MTAHSTRRLGLLGLVLLVGWVGFAGDRRGAGEDDAGAVMARALRGVTRPPPPDSPFLRGVSWTDEGFDGTSRGWVDSVSRRPRRAGVFTLQSYHDIVAVNVRLRVMGASRSDHAPPGAGGRNAFQQLDRTRAALQDMTREGSGTEPGPGIQLARTFLSGVVIERFSLQGPQADESWQLRSRLMTTTPSGDGWSLQEVYVRAANGDHLTIAAAEWRKDGSLVATGPYTIEKGGTRRGGSRGCFVIHLDGPLRLRRVSSTRSVCAPPISPTRGEPSTPAMPAFRANVREVPAAWPIAILLQPLVHSLATTAVPAGAPPGVVGRAPE